MPYGTLYGRIAVDTNDWDSLDEFETVLDRRIETMRKDLVRLARRVKEDGYDSVHQALASPSVVILERDVR